MDSYEIAHKGSAFTALLFRQNRALLVTGPLCVVDEDEMRLQIAAAVAPGLGGDVEVRWTEDTWSVDDVGVSRVARVRRIR